MKVKSNLNTTMGCLAPFLKHDISGVSVEYMGNSMKTLYHGLCVCLVARLCLTLCDSTDCSPPGYSIHGILQARILFLLFPSPGNLPYPGLEPGSLHYRQILYCLSHQGYTQTKILELKYLLAL